MAFRDSGGNQCHVKASTDGFCWAFITNTSNWTGPRFPHKIEGMMARAMDRVKEWPDRNLFDPDYCKAFEDGKKIAGQRKRESKHIPCILTTSSHEPHKQL